jgi:hypothetical protein
MLYKHLIILCAVCTLLPSPAMAKKIRVNDKSGNNSCKFVHDWFLKVKLKHAVFVTTGGVPYGVTGPKGGFCQAGGDVTLKSATDYAISKCERESRKHGNLTRCKVVESR